MCNHDDTIEFYGFEIFTNPISKEQYLLFKNIGYFCKNCNTVYKYNEKIYKYNKYGYMQMRTFDDCIKKYGPKPCFIVNHNKQIIDLNEVFRSDEEIRNKYKIKKHKVYEHNKMNVDKVVQEIINKEDTLNS